MRHKQGGNTPGRVGAWAGTRGAEAIVSRGKTGHTSASSYPEASNSAWRGGSTEGEREPSSAREGGIGVFDNCGEARRPRCWLIGWRSCTKRTCISECSSIWCNSQPPKRLAGVSILNLATGGAAVHCDWWKQQGWLMVARAVGSSASSGQQREQRAAARAAGNSASNRADSAETRKQQGQLVSGSTNGGAMVTACKP
jgi:hypothetical protein